MISWARHDKGTWAAAAAWAAVAFGLLLVWTFLVGWYVVIFGLFGLFTIPYRVIPRHRRKGLHTQQGQLATMQARR